MPLPNFLIIGAAKAGTTSLYDWLRQHSAVFMPRLKEPGFFAYDPGRPDLGVTITTLEQYAALFEGVTIETAVGEASTLYLSSPRAVVGIDETLPGVRLIAALRNPVERAYSTYQMNLRNRGANDGVPFLQALETGGGLRRGYAAGLARYFERFPRERIRIVLFEEIAKKPVETVRGLFEFLEVDPSFAPDMVKVSNPGGLPKVKLLHDLLTSASVRGFGRRVLPERLVARARDLRASNLRKQEMTLEERRVAAAFFREDTQRTQDLIGRDLSAWLRA
jgi:hypothetical protein